MKTANMPELIVGFKQLGFPTPKKGELLSGDAALRYVYLGQKLHPVCSVDVSLESLWQDPGHIHRVARQCAQ